MSDGSRKPFLACIMGPDYFALPPVIQRHFALRAESSDRVTVHGLMSEIWHSAVAKCWLPVGWAAGALIPWKGRGVPATVHYWVEGERLHWRREFRFPRRTHVFASYMEADEPSVGTEFVRFGIGTRLRIDTVDSRLRFRSVGFVWKAGRKWPLPVEWLLGKVTVEEWALDDYRFGMKAEIEHPRFGPLFRYAGEFKMQEE